MTDETAPPAGTEADAPPADASVPQPPASQSLAPQPPAPVTEEMLRLAEAAVFAAAGPVGPRALTQVLPAEADADAVIAALAARYDGRGVELVRVGGGVMFRTAPDLAPALRRVVQVPRRLPRVAMETLAIVAYHQPVTRAEIEEIRGASLGQATLDALLEAGLIMPKGRRESPGRPTLWGTTPAFLAQFGLPDLRALPRREDLLVEPVVAGTPPDAAPDEVAAAETPPPEAPAPEASAPEGPATEAPAPEAPATEAPATGASADAAPGGAADAREGGTGEAG